jgi:hypothetical protein
MLEIVGFDKYGSIPESDPEPEARSEPRKTMTTLLKNSSDD